MEMKEKDKEKEKKIAEILEHIWKVWDILRKEGFGVEDSHILLVLITMYKDDQLTPEGLDILFGGDSEKNDKLSD